MKDFSLISSLHFKSSWLKNIHENSVSSISQYFLRKNGIFLHSLTICETLELKKYFQGFVYPPIHEIFLTHWQWS